MGGAVFPPCYLPGVCYGGSNEDNGDLPQKIPHMHSRTQCPWPCTRPPPTSTSTGDSWILTGKSGSVSFRGHCSFLLGPGVHKVLFVSSKSLLPQSCVSSGGFVVGFVTTSSMRAYAIPRSIAPEPLPLWQATADLYLCRRHSNTQRQSDSVSVGSPSAHKVLFEPSDRLWWVW